ncbi:flagellar biosynthesis protein FlhF [Paenibacillus validus]|uniref:flagellar biosynthesis protein FlhF n=1 Tax=Paenibacillus validus TaxID=44253 RepID=UPI000FD775FC|nr:flagellar biosynthesis protein FlhF [Paenibacillus validus]MED4602699.1 flagellar biosynthesis protein FlhF [Paenibacillus validus]MED4607128.1 flagellar biosynthesis protein FlhF [Paenibacillus validus]
MRVKRYVVDSMPDALQKIRIDLGHDAVIINTKEIRTGGFLGMFSKKKIEVIAAMDTASPGGSAAGARTPAGEAAVVAAKSTAPFAAPPFAQSAKKTVAAAYGAQTLREEKQPVLAFPEVPDVLPPESAASFVPVQTAAPAPLMPVQRIQAAAPVKAKEDMLLEELKQMKEMMCRLSQQHGSAEQLNPAVQRFEQRLLEQEVEPHLVQELIAQVLEDAVISAAELSETFVKQSLQRQLLAMLRMEGSKSIAADTRIAHFVGPTGVGKTTTIAKLAAEQVLKHHRKVGFITSDTYRIAAVEQLKTYATILNVPLEVVFSPSDLTKAFDNLKDCDLIFMDTAGRNFRNEMYVSELNALLKSSGKSETFLVLSLTTKYKDMKAITSNFSKFKLHKVLFTKMDETDSYGAILNLVREFGLQISYIANGQSVPDDIRVLQEQFIIDLILEDDNHE